jgi:uncharacterized protein YaiE (UPF0345 family)
MGIQTKPSTGSRGVVHVGDESTYGVLVSPTHLIEFTSETLSATENVLMSEAIREDRGRHEVIRGNFDVQGELSFEQNTSGLGVILRHALGDYLLAEKVDGGIHARSAKAAVIETPVPDEGTDKRYTIVFADDHSGGFEPSGKFAVIKRDATGQLVLDNNADAGHDYAAYTPAGVTYVTAVTAGDDTHAGGTTEVPSITLAKVRASDGALVDPPFNPLGGVIKLGAGRKEYRYFEAKIAGGAVKVYLDPDDAAANGLPVVNDYVQVLACLTNDETAGTFAVGATLDKGQWIYQFDPTYTGVYTHHIERGRFLPVGLTIEVGRDAAFFLYSGAKVNTLNLTFDANAIVTGSASLVGRAEASIAKLLEDVVPGATSIKISNGDAFPNPVAPATAMITIGEETEIRYTTKTVNADGTVTLSGIAATGRPSIERFHPKGSNVDSRSSIRAANIIEGTTVPLSSFEIMVYMDGYFEEVLSGSLTLNNNLNTDKYGLGSRFRLATIENRAEVEGSLTMEFDDGKHYKKYIEGEYFSVEFKCVSEADGSEIGVTGVASQAYYFCPKARFGGTTPQISGTDIINMDMPFMAIVDDELKTTDLVIILVNANKDDCEIQAP